MNDLLTGVRCRATSVAKKCTNNGNGVADGITKVLQRDCGLQLWINLKVLCTDPFHFLLGQIIYPQSLYLLSPLTGTLCPSVMNISCFYARKTILATVDAGHRYVRMYQFCFFCVCVFFCAYFCLFVLLAHFVCLLATVDAGHRCVGRRKQGLMAQYLVAIPPYCRHQATSTFLNFFDFSSLCKNDKNYINKQTRIIGPVFGCHPILLPRHEATSTLLIFQMTNQTSDCKIFGCHPTLYYTPGFWSVIDFEREKKLKTNQTFD